MKLRTTVIMWDSGHRPDVDDINAACRYVKTTPYFYDVETETDMDCMLVSNMKITQARAQKLCDAELGEYGS